MISSSRSQHRGHNLCCWPLHIFELRLWTGRIPEIAHRFFSLVQFRPCIICHEFHKRIDHWRWFCEFFIIVIRVFVCFLLIFFFVSLSWWCICLPFHSFRLLILCTCMYHIDWYILFDFRIKFMTAWMYKISRLWMLENALNFL